MTQARHLMIFDPARSVERAEPQPHDGSAGPASSPGPDKRLRFHGFRPDTDAKLVLAGNAMPAVVEQFRKLAAALHLAQIDRQVKVIMVTSAVPGEGKTLTATNLALTLSESYRRRVLLIDADLRRPSIHTVLDLPNLSGLTDELKKDAQTTAAPLPGVIPVLPRLSVITAGRPEADPIGALTSQRMRQIAAQGAATYDWVIVDTPPVGLLPDAKLLADMVDGAILVISASRTAYALVHRAVATLGRDRILGVVLNRAAQRGGASGYDYYGYYYSADADRS